MAAASDPDSPSSEWYDEVLHDRCRLATRSSTDVVAVLASSQDHGPSSIDVVLAVLAQPQDVGTEVAPSLGGVPVPYQVVPSVSALDSASLSSVTSAVVPLPSVAVTSASSLDAFLHPSSLQPRMSSASRRVLSPGSQPRRSRSRSINTRSAVVLQTMAPASLQPRTTHSTGVVLPLASLHQSVDAAVSHSEAAAVLAPSQDVSSSFTTTVARDLRAVAVVAANVSSTTMARIRAAGWWHGLVPNGIRRSIALEADICLRFPRDEPLDLADYRRHCVRELKPIAASRYFYIGITDNPAHRWQQHCHSGSGYATMFLLAVAESSRTTGQLERQLIAMWRNPFRCANIGAGGECSSHGSPHFLYVVCRNDSFMRRAPTSGRGRDRMGRVEDFLNELNGL